MSKKTLFPILAAALLGLVCPATAEQITVLGVNDIHAALDNMPKLATLVKQERAKDPQALLLSAGDNRTGNPYSDMNPHSGWPVVAIMNRIGFNLSTLGNHSFDTGKDDMRYLVDNAEFRVVCANAEADDKDRILIQPYRIFERKGVTIGVLGLVETGKSGYPSALPENVKDFTFKDPFKVAQEYKWLRERCDVLILLTHLGFEDDVELAKQCPWVDAVVGGHSHTKVDGAHMVGNVMVTQAQSKAAYLTRITLDVQDGKVVSKEATLLPTAACEPDAEVAKMVQDFMSDPALNEQIAENVCNITVKEELGCLVTDAVREATGVDIAIFNFGGVRINALPAGRIRLCDVFRIDPFGSDYVLFKLSAQELRDFIIACTLRDHYGAPSASGITYSANLHKGNKLEITDIRLEDGTPLDPNKTYTVAIGRYASSAQFPHRDPGRALGISGQECVVKFLLKHGKVNYANVHRAHITRDPDVPLY